MTAPLLPGSEFPLELGDQGSRRLKHPSQHIADFCKVDAPAFFERYLNFDIGVCLKCRVRFSEGDAEDFYAFFRNLHRVGGTHPYNHSPGGETQASRYLLIRSNPDFVPNSGSGSNKDQQRVLIADIEIVEDGQKVVVGGGAVVRLFLLDEIRGAGAHAIYQSVVTGRTERFIVGADGEAIFPSWLPFLLQHQRRNQVI